MRIYVLDAAVNRVFTSRKWTGWPTINKDMNASQKPDANVSCNSMNRTLENAGLRFVRRDII